MELLRLGALPLLGIEGLAGAVVGGVGQACFLNLQAHASWLLLLRGRSTTTTVVQFEFGHAHVVWGHIGFLGITLCSWAGFASLKIASDVLCIVHIHMICSSRLVIVLEVSSLLRVQKCLIVRIN